MWLMNITQSQITVTVTLYHKHDMHRATQSWNTTQNTHSNRKTCEKRKLNQTHSTELTKPMFEHYIPQNLNNNSQIKKSKAKNMKYLAKIRKPLPFSWRLKLKWWRKMNVFESDMMSLRESWKDKTMNSWKCLRENPNVLKTDQIV